jgi:hypothetical protein
MQVGGGAIPVQCLLDSDQRSSGTADQQAPQSRGLALLVAPALTN